MIRENIDNLILTARKERAKDKLLVYQMIKSEFMYQSTKTDNPVVLDDAEEIKIIKNMVKQKTQAIENYKKLNNSDAVAHEENDIVILNSLLPAAPKQEEYEKVLDDFVASLGDTPLDKKQMGLAIKYIKENLLFADGKLASQIVNSRINKA